MPAKFQSKKGYLLVESLIAITVVVVGLLGIFSLLSRALSLNRVISDRYVASYLAAEGIEVIKNLIDNNALAGRAWNEGLADGRYQIDYLATALLMDCGFTCNQVFYFDPVNKIYSYSPNGQRTSFNRILSLQSIRDKGGLVQSIRINSIVEWSGRGSGQFSVNLEDHFYNYR